MGSVGLLASEKLDTWPSLVLLLPALRASWATAVTCLNAHWNELFKSKPWNSVGKSGEAKGRSLKRGCGSVKMRGNTHG